MKTFSNKKELFAYLVENKQELVELKKAARKFSDDTGFLTFIVPETTATKGKYMYENDEEKGVLKRTIIANTYNWMDSHGDVHLSGLFGKSISERSNKIPHLHDHKFELSARVGKPQKFEEKQISWRELGVGKTGMTEALFMESEIRKSYNDKVFNDYLNDDVDQHSVAMQYVKIELAVNDEEEYPKEYAVWEKILPLLGNRKEAEAKGYFWAVSEAKLVEVSAVLLGSNELTPTMGNKNQPLLDTEEKAEPSVKDTQLLEAINKLYNKLTTEK